MVPRPNGSGQIPVRVPKSKESREVNRPGSGKKRQYQQSRLLDLLTCPTGDALLSRLFYHEPDFYQTNQIVSAASGGYPLIDCR